MVKSVGLCIMKIIVCQWRAMYNMSLKKRGLRLTPNCVTLLSGGYRLDMDVTGDLKAYGVQFYQELIGTCNKSSYHIITLVI